MGSYMTPDQIVANLNPDTGTNMKSMGAGPNPDVPGARVHRYLTVMLINTSLAQGQMPTSHKQAIITMLLKKVGVETGDMGNYRPVSKLTSLSTLIELDVASHLGDCKVANYLCRATSLLTEEGHSAETAMFRICSDILTAADQR